MQRTCTEYHRLLYHVFRRLTFSKRFKTLPTNVVHSLLYLMELCVESKFLARCLMNACSNDLYQGIDWLGESKDEKDKGFPTLKSAKQAMREFCG